MIATGVKHQRECCFQVAGIVKSEYVHARKALIIVPVASHACEKLKEHFQLDPEAKNRLDEFHNAYMKNGSL